MKIIFSGDFYISDSFQDKDLLDQSIIDLFQKADFRMVNLEGPITLNESKNKILKTGPHLRMSEETVLSFLKQIKVDAVTLANNHILDYGVIGLLDTFESLRKHKIDYLGAGHNMKEAIHPLTIEKDGLRIAILNFCENEWSIADENRAGANPLDIIENTRQIIEANKTHDKVICIIHGGHEYYHLPSPRMQKQYRFYVDNGADAIVGHHTHCIGGYEVYNDAPIIYSLGNFIFTKPSNREVWYEGLLTKLIIERDRPIEFKLFPVKQHIDNFQTSLISKEYKVSVFEKIKEINRTIVETRKLQNRWDEFLQHKSNLYLNIFSPISFFNNRYLSYLVKKVHLGKWFMNKNHYKLMLNIMRCEAHLDASKKVFDNFLKLK